MELVSGSSFTHLDDRALSPFIQEKIMRDDPGERGFQILKNK
jgi:hypothetical protein